MRYMKIAAINGSPRGKSSNTHSMVSAFLQGAQAAGAETLQIMLADKEVKHCQGCFSCWLHTPGRCVLQDDMADILSLCEGANILVLATPLYVDNISGMLKDFVDRMIMKGNPHFQKDPQGECRHLKNSDRPSPRLVMMANCGFPERSHFQVISHWITRMALNMHTEVLGEFYVAQGSLLSQASQYSSVAAYLHGLENAGRQLALGQTVAADTKQLLEQDFVSDDVYIQSANSYFDAVLNNR